MRFPIVSLAAILGLTVSGSHGCLKAEMTTAGPVGKVSAKGTTPEGGLKQRITVVVENLAEWIKQGNDPKKLQLVLDGRVLKGVTADYLGENSSTLKFDLTQNADNRDAWTALLSRGGNLGTIAPQLGVLAVFAAGFLALATYRLRRRLL